MKLVDKIKKYVKDFKKFKKDEYIINKVGDFNKYKEFITLRTIVTKGWSEEDKRTFGKLYVKKKWDELRDLINKYENH